LNQSGKIDRKALPQVGSEIDTGALYEAPSTQLEIKLAEIWQELLGVENISVNDDFFDLGGHSLTANIMVARLHKELSVEVPMKEVFKNSTVRELAGYIQRSSGSEFESINKTELREYYPLSAAQKRLFSLYELDRESTSYNMPMVMYLEGNLDRERFEAVMQKVVERHEALRTMFIIVEDVPVQKVEQSVAFNLEFIDNADEDKINDIVVKFIRPFDLGKAPLIRAALVCLGRERHLLLVDMHHIISDGTSIDIIFNDIAGLYKGATLEPLAIQYKDYAVWQQERYINSEKYIKQKAYWKKVFTGDIPELGLITDYPRPLVLSNDGDRVGCSVGREIMQGLRKLTAETGTTLFMALLAAYNVLLSKYTRKSDIVVGAAMAGRSHADLEKVVGMFVNTLALRNHITAGKTFKEFLNDVKTTTLEAIENQDYQFDELVKMLGIRWDLGRNPLFDTMFTLQNIEIKDIEIDGLKFKPYEMDNRIAKFDIALFASENGDDLYLEMEYRTQLYKRETIKRMLGHFVDVLKVISKGV
ncbi:MAG: non-ribosomal peptide synthetase, partial [Clostridiaceae bacterium]|nr:non-ribosomal peptide synthetase [Clostridiaceae bacterium]